VSSLTPQDYPLALVTPKHFTALFGGFHRHERPRSVTKNNLCLNRNAQPYAPISPGKAGLLFVMPNTIVLEDNCESFHIFMSMSESTPRTGKECFRYFGTYIKVPITRTTLGVDEWCSLSFKCRNIWSRHIISSGSREKGAVLARVSIRQERPNGPPPSLDDINQWLEANSRKCRKIPNPVVRAALDSGEENIKFEVVKCIRYDLEIVKQLQETSRLSEGTSCQSEGLP